MERKRTITELKTLFSGLKGKPITDQMMRELINAMYPSDVNITSLAAEKVIPDTANFAGLFDEEDDNLQKILEILDDHNHDDRYYTESEINTILADYETLYVAEGKYSLKGHTHSYAPVSGSANYIQNQTNVVQSANFYISGEGRMYKTSLYYNNTQKRGELVAGIDTLSLYTSGQYALQFGTNNGIRATMDKDGYMSFTYQVTAPTIKLTTGAGAGKVLISDTLGVSSWNTLADAGIATAGHNHDTAYAPISGSANYIQNRNDSAQSANLWIDGIGKFGKLQVTTEVNDYDGLTITNGTTKWNLITGFTGYYNSNLIFLHKGSEWKTIKFDTNGNIIADGLVGTGTRLVTADLNGQLGSSTALSFIGNDYIKNQNASAQLSANIWIDGEVVANGRFATYNGIIQNPTSTNGYFYLYGLLNTRKLEITTGSSGVSLNAVGSLTSGRYMRFNVQGSNLLQLNEDLTSVFTSSVQASRFISDVATGTAPFTVASTSRVVNLTSTYIGSPYWNTLDLNSILVTNSFRYDSILYGSTNAFPMVNNANAVLTLDAYPDGLSNLYHQIGFSGNGNMYYRNYLDTSWYKIWHSGNLRSNSDNDSRFIRHYGLVNSEADAVPSQHSTGFYSVSSSSTGGADGFILSSTWTNGAYTTQIYYDVDPTSIMSIRHRDSASNWTSWYKFWHSGNLTNTLSATTIPYWDGSKLVNSVLRESGGVLYWGGSTPQGRLTWDTGYAEIGSVNSNDFKIGSATGVIKVLPLAGTGNRLLTASSTGQLETTVELDTFYKNNNFGGYITENTYNYMCTATTYGNGSSASFSFELRTMGSNGNASGIVTVYNDGGTANPIVKVTSTTSLNISIKAKRRTDTNLIDFYLYSAGWVFYTPVLNISETYGTITFTAPTQPSTWDYTFPLDTAIGLNADLLDGQHGSYYATANSLGNYLPLSGGTMTGGITWYKNFDTGILYDLTFTTSSIKPSGDNRAALIRSYVDGGNSGTRGGLLYFYTRVPNSDNFNQFTFNSDGSFTSPGSITSLSGNITANGHVIANGDDKYLSSKNTAGYRWNIFTGFPEYYNNYLLFQNSSDGKGMKLIANGQLILDAAQGTAPLSVSSTSMVANLTSNFAYSTVIYSPNAAIDYSAMDIGRTYDYGSGQQRVNGPSGMSYGSVYNLGGGTQYQLSLQIAADINHNVTNSTKQLWFRTGNNLGFQNDWKEIYHSGNLRSNSDNDSRYVQTQYNSSLNTDSRNTRGVTRLYRWDNNEDFSVQVSFVSPYWRLLGYNGDTYHAGVSVHHADLAAVSSTTNTINVIDNRAADRQPSYYSYGINAFFTNSIPESSGDWTSAITVRGWSDPNYNSWQLIGGSTSVSRGKWWFREGISSFGTAYQIWHSGNLRSNSDNDSRYIREQYTSAQSGNMWIAGTGRFGQLILGQEQKIYFRNASNSWDAAIGFTGNLGTIAFPGSNLTISSGYNSVITLDNGYTGYESGYVHIPFGKLGVGITPSYRVDIKDPDIAEVRIGGGSAASYVNAAILFQNNGAQSYRGLGTFYLDTAGQHEWYVGTPYAIGDSFMIGRRGSATSHSTATAQTSYSFMRIFNDSSISMGTDTPLGNTQLTVNLVSGGGGAAIAARYSNNTTDLGEAAFIAFRNSAWSNLYLSGSGSSTTYGFYVGGTKVNYINSTLGIGYTDTETYKLKVNGTAYFNGDIGIPNGSYIRGGNPVPTVDNQILMYNGGTGDMEIELHNTNWYLRHNANMTVAGYVGIGYTDPESYRLKVNGTAYFNGALTFTARNAFYIGTKLMVSDYTWGGANTNVWLGGATNSTVTGTNSTEGNYNTAIGMYALSVVTTGYSNVGLGFYSLKSVTSGRWNIGIGTSSAWQLTTGHRNVAVGLSSLYSLTTGSDNFAFGANAGDGITTGSGNLIFGNNIMGLDANLTNNIIFGSGEGTIRARFDGTNWNFNSGILKANYLHSGRPANKIDNGSVNEFSAFDINNSFVAGQSAYVRVSYPTYNNLRFYADYDGNVGGAIPNIQFGKSSGITLQIGADGNVVIGGTTSIAGHKLAVLGNAIIGEQWADSTLVISGVSGYGGVISTSGQYLNIANYRTGHTIFSGNGVEAFRYTGDGKVVIGGTTANAKLDVIGSMRINDQPFYFRGGADTNHATIWHGATDGPFMYGYAGAALGYTSTGSPVRVLYTSGNNVVLPYVTANKLMYNTATGISVVNAAETSGHFLQTNGSGVYTWAAASSGFSNPMSAVGDIIIGGTSGAATRLEKGTSGKVLKAGATTVSWEKEIFEYSGAYLRLTANLSAQTFFIEGSYSSNPIAFFRNLSTASYSEGIYVDVPAAVSSNFTDRFSLKLTTEGNTGYHFGVETGGNVVMKAITAPSPGTNPASGKGWLFIDSSDSKLKFKNSAGTLYDLTATGGSSQWTNGTYGIYTTSTVGIGSTGDSSWIQLSLGNQSTNQVYTLSAQNSVSTGIAGFFANTNTGTSSSRAIFATSSGTGANMVVDINNASQNSSAIGVSVTAHSGYAIYTTQQYGIGTYSAVLSDGTSNWGGMFVATAGNWGIGVSGKGSRQDFVAAYSGIISMVETNSPSNPSTGYSNIYSNGGLLYIRNSGGTSTIVGTQSSDYWLKKDFRKLETPLEKILQVNGYSFNYQKEPAAFAPKDAIAIMLTNDTGKRDASGVIAQEIEKLIPESVYTSDNGYKSVNYNQVVPYLIESIKELNNKIETLESKLKSYESN